MAIPATLQAFGKIGLTLLKIAPKVAKVGIDVAKVVGPAAAKGVKMAAAYTAKHPAIVENLVSVGVGVFIGDAWDNFVAGRGIRTSEVESYYEYLQQLETSGINEGTITDLTNAIKDLGPQNGQKKNHPEWWAEKGRKHVVRDMSIIEQDLALKEYTCVSLGYDPVKAIKLSKLEEILKPNLKNAVQAYYKRYSFAYTSEDGEKGANAMLNILYDSMRMYALIVTWYRCQNEWGVRVVNDHTYAPLWRGYPSVYRHGTNTVYPKSDGSNANGYKASGKVKINSPMYVNEGALFLDSKIRSSYWQGMSNAVWNEKLKMVRENAYLSPVMKEYIDYLFDSHHTLNEPNAEPVWLTFFPKDVSDETMDGSVVPSFNQLSAYLDTLKNRIDDNMQVYRASASTLALAGFRRLTEELSDMNMRRDVHGTTIKYAAGDNDLRYALANATYDFPLRSDTATWSHTTGVISTDLNSTKYLPALSVCGNIYSVGLFVPEQMKVAFNFDNEIDRSKATVQYDYGKMISLMKFRIPYNCEEDRTEFDCPLSWWCTIRYNDKYEGPDATTPANKRFLVVGYMSEIFTKSCSTSYTYGSRVTIEDGSIATPSKTCDLDLVNYNPEYCHGTDMFDNFREMRISVNGKLKDGSTESPTTHTLYVDTAMENRHYTTLAKVMVPVEYQETASRDGVTTRDGHNEFISFHLGNAFARAMFNAAGFKAVAEKVDQIKDFYSMS